MRNFGKVVAGLLLAIPVFAHASDRVVRVIVPYGNGDLDSLGRLFSQQVATILKETWVVENMAGANGTIGSNHVARAKPDGLTILFSANGLYVAPLVAKNVPYDPLKDFTPIAPAIEAPLVLVVNPKVAANNLGDLVKDIKKDPQSFSFGYPGLGTSPHIAAAIFQAKTGAKALMVPYKSTGAATTDVMAGHVNMIFLTPLLSTQLVHAGKLKAIAITSAKRFDGAPGVPTAAESGTPDFVMTNTYGFWGPKGMPKAEVDRLNQAMRQASESPEVKKQLTELGMAPVWQAPQAFAENMAKQFETTRDILKSAGVEPE